MRINHNLAALNTYRMETIAVQGQQKHIEKLSSGMKINRAADDAAGLPFLKRCEVRSEVSKWLLRTPKTAFLWFKSWKAA